MIDCPNVEIRELLPEYLNGTLDGSRRGEVEAHLASCAECRAELETIRLVREAYAAAGTVEVDVPAIVAALPKPNQVRRQVYRRSWARNHAVQIAAAISFIAVGGMSVVVSRSFFTGEQPDSSVVATSVDSSSPVEAVPAISFAGGVSDLGDEELETLLSALDAIEALPVAEPATMVISAAERQGI